MSDQSQKTNAELQDEVRELRGRIHELEGAVALHRLTGQELRASERKSRAWLEYSPVCTKIVGLDHKLRYMSRSGVAALGIDDISEHYGQPYPLSFYPEEFRVGMMACMDRVKRTGEVETYESSVVGLGGDPVWFHSTLVPVRDDAGRIDCLMIVSSNITERTRAEAQRAALASELSEARKLESLTLLAAGIAHEINTPTQFISDNTQFLQESFDALVPLLERAGELADAVRDGVSRSDLAVELRTALDEADVEFLAGEVPRALEQSRDGIASVRKIAWSMNEFSQPAESRLADADLKRAIESAITVSANEWRYVADVETHFDPELPLVPCLPGAVGQVVLTLLINAANAIANKLGDHPGEKGKITLCTRQFEEFAEISVSDTGAGIPEENRSRIFDPYFTTRPFGEGTGQSLALARSIVVREHGGTLEFETEDGVGTTFTLRLPLEVQTVE